MNIKNIESNADFEIGKYYHCFDRSNGIHSIHECYKHDNEPKHLGVNKIWADDENNQALKKWAIFGPIDVPMIGGINLCKTHHGIGFKSDCMACKHEMKIK